MKVSYFILIISLLFNYQISPMDQKNTNFSNHKGDTINQIIPIIDLNQLPKKRKIEKLKHQNEFDTSELNPHECDIIYTKNSMVIIYSNDGKTYSVPVRINKKGRVTSKTIANRKFLEEKEGTILSSTFSKTSKQFDFYHKNSTSDIIDQKTDKALYVQTDQFRDFFNNFLDFPSIHKTLDPFENLTEELCEKWIASINQEQK